MHQRELAEQAAAQAAPTRPQRRKRCWKPPGPRRHAAQVADTTAAMTAAKQKLLELETRRLAAAQKVLASVQAKVAAEEALAADSGTVVATLDDARARKAARQAKPAGRAPKAVWRAR
jgi:hypothetical protein